MRDRQPTQPGRVKITPENGDSYFAVVEMADEPTEFGTPPTKENLLSDDAEISLFGSPADRTVSEAFLGISAKLKLIMSDMASITLTVTDQAGNPVKNVLVNGIYSDSGAAVYTNDSGVASGYIAEGSQTISIKNYADLEDISKTLTVVKGSTITEAITATRRNFLKLTESKIVKFSGNASTVDVTSVGGGGASGACASDLDHREVASGGSGAGGYCVVQDNIAIEPNKSYQAIIGSGASVGALKGGKTSFLGVEADGGNSGTDATRTTSGSSSYANIGIGGIGNGNGVNGIKGENKTPDIVGTQGNPGTVDGFSSFTETVKYGGSGGGGAFEADSHSSFPPNGGSGGGFGGDGGQPGSAGQPGQDGFGGGAGAPGIRAWYDDDGHNVRIGSPAKGGSGCVAIRIHFDFGDLAT